MDASLIAFFVLALVAVGSALGMLLNKNAVYAALFLILNFATMAVFYLMLGAPFVAMTQVAVYAGAIMVLFLFVIMLLGAERLPVASGFDWQKPVAVVLGVLLLAEAAAVIFFREQLFAPIAAAPEGYAAPAEVGLELFQEYLLPFEITAVLLLAAMVGAIVIAKSEKKVAPKGKAD